MSHRSDWQPTQTAIRALSEFGGRQLGLVTVAQLDSIGLGSGWRVRAAKVGWLERIRPGVYAMPGSTPSWNRSVLAAVLASGPDTVASHETAAILWGLCDRGQSHGQIHLTSPKRHCLDGVIVHRRDLSSRERGHHRDVPVTSVARTLFDLASVMSADHLGRCTDEALRRSIVTVGEMNRLLALHGGAGRRRLRPIQQVLAERLPGFDPGANDWERRMDDMWDELGLPAAERQYRIRAGSRHYRVDRAIPALRLAVEWVGTEYHAQVGAFRRDRGRIGELALIGWDVLEITPDWTSERVKRTVMAKIAERKVLLAHQDESA